MKRNDIVCHHFFRTLISNSSSAVRLCTNSYKLAMRLEIFCCARCRQGSVNACYLTWSQ
jgi:hypothetical protein